MIKFSESRPPRQLAANMLLLSVSVVLPLLIAEASLRVFGLLEQDRQAIEPTAITSDDRTPRSAKHKLHPFLGWTRRDFESDLADYIAVKDSDFVIGIFGGSVAKNLATTHGEHIASALMAERPDLETVRVLRFGIGGYKQPQQLFLLCQMLLLGIQFDVIVNIDGYNEVAFGSTNADAGFHPLYPKMSLLTTLTDIYGNDPSPAAIELSAAVLASKRRASQRREYLIRYPLLGRSEFVKALLGRSVRQAEIEAARLEIQLQELAESSTDNDFSRLGTRCHDTSQSCWGLIAELWMESSRIMAAVAANAGARYVHILQPNQYVIDSKELSPDERTSAYDPSLRESRAATLGYPHLASQGAELRKQGVAYHDLTMLFKDYRPTTYRDVCCHLNEQGNKMLAEAVVDLIDTTLDSPSTAISAMAVSPSIQLSGTDSRSG